MKDRDILLISGWDDSVTAIEDNILPFYRSQIKNCANKVKIEAIQDDHEFLHSRDRLVEIIMDWLNKEQQETGYMRSNTGPTGQRLRR